LEKHNSNGFLIDKLRIGMKAQERN